MISHLPSSSGHLSSCSLVEVVVADCIHQEVGEKNPKPTRSMGFILGWGFVETPPVPLLDDVTLDQGTFHESLTSSKMLQLSLTTAVESTTAHYSPSAKMNTFILQVIVLVLGGEFSQQSHYVREDIGMIRRTYAPFQDLSFLSLLHYLETQLVAPSMHTLLHSVNH